MFKSKFCKCYMNFLWMFKITLDNLVWAPIIMHNNILLQDNLLFMITNILFSLLFACTEIFFSIICNTPEQWEEQKVVIWTPYYNLFAWRSFTWFSLSHIHIQFSLKHIHMFVCNVVHIFVVCAVAVFSFLFKSAHDQVFCEN